MARKKVNTRKRNRRGGGFRSLFERDFAQNLKRRKVPFSFETEKIKWIPPVKEKTYTPDFLLEKHDGNIMYIETKGLLTLADRIKMVAVIEQHPDIDLRIVFQNAKNKIRKGSATTYADWARSVGIKWSEKTIPASWRKECKNTDDESTNKKV